MRELTVARPWRPRHLSRLTLTTLSLSALVAPLALAYREVSGAESDDGVLAIVSAVVFVLVILRLIGLVRAQMVDARREQVLRGFSDYLVTATDRAEVLDAGISAILNIGAAGVIGCIVVLRESNIDMVVASTWPEFIGLSVEVTRVDSESDARLVVLGGGRTVSETPDSVAWTRLRSHDLDFSKERVLLAHDRALPIDLRAILDGIADQLFLALERVELARMVLEGKNERRFQAMVKYSSDVITLLGKDLHVLYQSPAVLDILGRAPSELVGLPLADLIYAHDVPIAQAQLSKILTGGLGSTSDFEIRVAHKDGQWRTVNVVITNLFDEPDVGAIVLNIRDVTDRHALEQELNHQAFHDTLTGLANRALFFDRLTHAMDKGARGENAVAVLFLDLDDFKAVNDSFGHPAGDDLLVEVAQRVRSATRPGDTVARFGGDEFAVLVESGTMPEAAQVVARRIIEGLTPSFRILANDIAMRASIGIAVAEQPQMTPDDLLRDADLAMYVAKRNGKGRYEMYRPKMHEDAVRLLETEVGIREGLDSNEFEVFYQPIVSAHTGRLIAAEALVRWNHPTRGLLAPIEFIGVAEDTGLIVPLGRQVLFDAAAQAQAWRREGVVGDDFYVSVNLSTHQLQESTWSTACRKPWRPRGFPPKDSSWRSPRAHSSRISPSPCLTPRPSRPGCTSRDR